MAGHHARARWCLRTGHDAKNHYCALVFKAFLALLGNDPLGAYDTSVVPAGQVIVQDMCYVLFLNCAGVYVVFSNFVRVVLLIESFGAYASPVNPRGSMMSRDVSAGGCSLLAAPLPATCSSSPSPRTRRAHEAGSCCVRALRRRTLPQRC